MSAVRLSALICASMLLSPPARAEEAFVTQLRLPARGQSVDVFAWRDARGISVESAALTRLGIVAPEGARAHLADIPGLAYVERDGAAAIELSCAAACFATQRLSARDPGDAPVDASPWGGYLNYDFVAEWREAGSESLGALLEANVFGPLGRGEASWLAHAEEGATRLETRWTFDMPAQRLRLRVGDSVLPSVGGGLRRFGGVEIGRHFALTPRAVTHPTPQLAGEAETASTAELYIDGALRARERVEAGPFELEEPPLTSGAGEAQLVVTDMLGRQQIITRPFYVSTALLRPGLSDWSLAAGWAREAFGRESMEYGAAFVAARYRQGLSDAITGEIGAVWHEEALELQISAAAAHPLFGLVQLEYARVDEAGAVAFAWLREARGWSFGLQVQARDAGFAPLGEKHGARMNAAASFHAELGALGDLSLTAAAVRFETGADGRTFAVTYAPDLQHATLNIQLAYAERERSELSLGVGLRVPLEGDISASLAGAWDRQGGSYRADAQGGDALRNWRVRAAGGAYERLDAAFSHAKPYADARVAGAWTPRGAGLRLELTGAVGWIAEYAFAAPPIESAFAMIDVGAADIGVSRDRLRVGASGANGRLLAPHLRAYDSNVIAIEAEDLPLDRAPRVVAQSVRPAEGAGVIVRFADARAVIIESNVLFADGAPAPRGGVLVRGRDGARIPVGSDGRIVMQDARDGDIVRLESDTRCAARADAAAAASGLILNCASAA